MRRLTLTLVRGRSDICTFCAGLRNPWVLAGYGLWVTEPKAQKSLKVLDLFSGAGGLTAGFAVADSFRTVRAVEMDPQAAASYRATFGDVVDVMSVGDWLRESDVPEVDVVTGGPPCQGFSSLGKRSLEDVRNLLWRDYADAIVRSSPKYFVLENVTTFISSPQFTKFLNATRGNGRLRSYTFRAAVLNAADFGAPQARKRAIVIGWHRDLPDPGMPTPTHAGRHQTVGGALQGVPRSPVNVHLPRRFIELQGKRVPGAFSTEELHVGRTYEPQSLARIRCIPPGGNRFDLPKKLQSSCWQNHPSGSADVMGRLRHDRPSVTIRTEFFKPEKGRYLHPTEDRAITHLEAALLQGFPLTHRWVGSKVAIARQIGNAVPIPLGTAIAKHLAAQ